MRLRRRFRKTLDITELLMDLVGTSNEVRCRASSAPGTPGRAESIAAAKAEEEAVIARFEGHLADPDDAACIDGLAGEGVPWTFVPAEDRLGYVRLARAPDRRNLES
jgi:hypothetical protein